MATNALDILNSLEEPVEAILEEKNYNFNTDKGPYVTAIAPNNSVEMPLELEPYDPNIGEIGFGIPGSGEGLELLYNTAKDLFNRGFITETAGGESDLLPANSYQPMVPDERNVLQELPEILSNLEYRDIIANSVLNTPDMLFDMLTVGPHLGHNLIVGHMNDDMIGGALDYADQALENVIMPKIDEFQYDDKFAEGEKALEAMGSGVMAFPLYKKIMSKLPQAAQKFMSLYAPYTHKVAHSKNAGNFFKSLFTGMGGRTIPTLAATTAAGAGITAGLGTLLYSGPAGADTDIEPFEGVYATNNNNNFTYNPNPNINTGIQNSDPVVFDSYMQDKLDNFEPRPKAPGPRNNYQGM
jgi:hypothetical protein